MAMDPRERFGRQVRRYRKANNWSQEKLAAETGLDRTYIGGVERGQRNIALLNIHKIADALGIQVQELFKGEPS